MLQGLPYAVATLRHRDQHSGVFAESRARNVLERNLVLWKGDNLGGAGLPPGVSDYEWAISWV